VTGLSYLERTAFNRDATDWISSITTLALARFGFIANFQ
jgi:hypothetical protein